MGGLQLHEHVVDRDGLGQLAQCTFPFLVFKLTSTYLTLCCASAAQDSFSWNKEQASGHYCHNVTSVIMKQENCSVQRANDIIAEHCDVLMKAFFESKKNLRSFGSKEVDDTVAFYIKGLEHWISGNLIWSYKSGRYFGDASEEVFETRVVQVRPRKIIHYAPLAKGESLQRLFHLCFQILGADHELFLQKSQLLQKLPRPQFLARYLRLPLLHTRREERDMVSLPFTNLRGLGCPLFIRWSSTSSINPFERVYGYCPGSLSSWPIGPRRLRCAFNLILLPSLTARISFDYCFATTVVYRYVMLPAFAPFSIFCTHQYPA